MNGKRLGIGGKIQVIPQKDAFLTLLKNKGYIIDNSKVSVAFLDGYIEFKDGETVQDSERLFDSDGRKVYNHNYAVDFLITNNLVKRP
ncbi:hypothetical protein ABC382_00950 [Lysinibacillus sp. 1P01SD]|uniref:hypothetical protein n=1 Tax=Lysinibacillus sp. 1P01SD TaxID=3132285 RepID=UPI0039A0F88C